MNRSVVIPVHEVCEIPPGHCTSIPLTNVALVIFSKQLHSHHGKYKDDNTQHEGQVRQGANRVHHNG